MNLLETKTRFLVLNPGYYDDQDKNFNIRNWS